MLPPPHRFHASYFSISVQLFVPSGPLFFWSAPACAFLVRHSFFRQPMRAHQRRVPLIDTNTHQHGKAGEQNCDAAPPMRFAVCHFVLPCETGVVHALTLLCASQGRCTHGTNVCAWHTHAPPICSSAALAAPRCRDLSSAALLCGPHGEKA